jgi:non-heme chloroperoxidase
MVPMRHHTLRATDGTRLHVRECGNPEGPPLLLIHGWSQSELCWRAQYESELAQEFRLVAPDLRGHGQSDKPPGEGSYQDPRQWAHDVQTVIRELTLERPVLVGWSYGSLVSALYVREYGDEQLAGINFVGGACRVSPAEIGTLLGTVFLEVLPLVTSEDLGENIVGLRHFLQACFTAPLSREDWETALAFNAVVPPHVRAALLGKPIDTTATLAGLRRPLLVSHGRADAVTLPAMAELILASCPTARASWYDSVGHGPFIEAPKRFNVELAEFARNLHP